MTDIKIRHKELETAKKIRDNDGCCLGVPGVYSCFDSYCPGKNSSGTECLHWRKPEWDSFIAAREAELAQTPEEPGVIMSSGKTVDDFAIALIIERNHK